MSESPIVILTESRYENPTVDNAYIRNLLFEDSLFARCLEQRGLSTRRIDWARADFDWSSARAAVFRSTWDYFDRYASFLPTLTALRRRAAWFTESQVNFLPTNTAAGHSTISTGTDPRVHGITGVSVYDFVHGRRHDMFAGGSPDDLLALTLSDVWQFATSGRAIILAQGSIDRAATPLAGHGSCQLNGAPVTLAIYDQELGGWRTNPNCFRLPDYLKDRSAKTLLPADGEWRGRRIDSTSAVRYSALFPAFEADAITTMIEREPVGQDDIADLILLNYKGADFVGHRYGPDSEELRLTLAEMDRHLTRIVSALEAKV